MKKLIAKVAFVSSFAFASTQAFAVAPGGPDCGWGNMLFEGSSGLGSHIAASFTNGTSGNATFGMTSGTNGCSHQGTLTYSGKAMINLSSVMDEFINDAAKGEGEAMTAVAVSMGIEGEDREHFAATIHNNFDAIFASEDMTAEEVYSNINVVLKNDARLARYAV